LIEGVNFASVAASSQLGVPKAALMARSGAAPSLQTSVPTAPKLFAAAEPGKVELYSQKFYALCGVAGVLACGITHTMVVPLDLVKCRMQTNPKEYPNLGAGFKRVVATEGAIGLTRGWVPTAIGYSMQGACKFGFYEFFKKKYRDSVGEENFDKYQDFVYLAASASAEFIADVALCPMEAVKVRIQTQPGYAKGLADGLPKFVGESGVAGLWKGVAPLWFRQIPYTMAKFLCFERAVQFLYKNVFTKPRTEYSKVDQLGVAFLGGYIAGVVCAVVSHPADSIVSKLNKDPKATIGGIYKEMGFLALMTKGLGARIIMIGTLTGLQWGIYDGAKVFFGLPATGNVKKAPAAVEATLLPPGGAKTAVPAQAGIARKGSGAKPSGRAERHADRPLAGQLGPKPSERRGREPSSCLPHREAKAASAPCGAGFGPTQKASGQESAQASSRPQETDL